MALKKVREEWFGDEFIARERRANGRAVVGMGVQVAVAMKKVAHVESGDNRRAIHVAGIDSMGQKDVTQPGMDFEAPVTSAEAAKVGETKWKIEVGSWEPYACVENNRGGEHRFADIGWELARPTFDPTLQRAWREEGL